MRSVSVRNSASREASGKEWLGLSPSGALRLGVWVDGIERFGQRLRADRSRDLTSTPLEHHPVSTHS